MAIAKPQEFLAAKKNKGRRLKIMLTNKEILQIEALAAYLTIDDIANHFGIGERTFYRIKNRQDEVLAAYKRGMAKARSRVGSKLMRFIDSDDLTATTLDATKFYLTHQGGWVKTQEMNVTTKDVTPQPPTYIYNFNNKVLDAKFTEVKEAINDDSDT